MRGRAVDHRHFCRKLDQFGAATGCAWGHRQLSDSEDFGLSKKLGGKQMFVPHSRPAGHVQADFGKALVVIGGVWQTACIWGVAGAVRARAEPVFRVIKCQFGYRQVRDRGLAKNQAQRFGLMALVNLSLARRCLMGNSA